jgi:protein required for attachment to host cells
MKMTGKIQDNLKEFSSKPLITRPYKIPRIWVMVADQHIARIFEKVEKKRLESIGEAHPDLLEKAEISNKSLGRVASSGGGSVHHKYEPHMNAGRQESLSFVHELSDWLDKAVQEDAFDQLVLVAPPQTLGELRKVLKPPVHARILAELNKDLTKMNKLALQEELTKTVWF